MTTTKRNVIPEGFEEVEDQEISFVSFEKVGEEIRGTLFEYRTNEYGNFPVIKTLNDGSLFGLPSLSVLQTKLKRAAIGDEVYIKHTGSATSQKGRDYKTFLVGIKHQTPF